MAAGYFDDGTVNVELGAHVFGTPSAARPSITHRPWGDPAAIMDTGGGILSIEVTAQRVRANLGDAESYIYNLLAALAVSEAGDLGCEDNRGNQHVFGDSVFLMGTGAVRGHAFADMSLDFECPEKSSEPAWGAVPATPGVYAGTSTLQDYTAGGVLLGVGGGMEIEASRSYDLREIPRARGSRTSVPPKGAHMTFRVTAERVVTTTHMATEIENLVRSIGPRPVDLVANGGTYCDVLLTGARAAHGEQRHTSILFTFAQELS